MKCPSYEVCAKWAMIRKKVSILSSDTVADEYYASGSYVGENSEPLMCRLGDGLLYITGLAMIIFHADPLMRRVNNIIDRVVKAGLYKFWISWHFHKIKLRSRKIAIVHQLDEYYGFNLYNMQPAFYFVFIGWCLSALCFMVELLYKGLFHKRM